MPPIHTNTSGAFANLLQRDPLELRKQFLAAEPFPHLVIEEAIDEEFLAESLSRWPAPNHPGWNQYQRGKRAFHNVDLLSSPLKDLLLAPYTGTLLRFFGDISGVPELLGDVTFSGAGLHEVVSGGSLGIHIDFNTLAGRYRRLNMLLYVNRAWHADWNGALQLRREPLSVDRRVVIEPRWNRMVLFESSERSWHGHPEPLYCPSNVTRKAIAWYFYTDAMPSSFREGHSTIYRG